MAPDQIQKELTEIKQLLERINKKLTMQNAAPETWVRGSLVMEMTIFNTPNKIRKARRQGLLKFRGSGNQMRYSIKHIDTKFFVSNETIS